MKTKYTELKATELIETTGGENVLFAPLGGGGLPYFPSMDWPTNNFLPWYPIGKRGK